MRRVDDEAAPSSFLAVPSGGGITSRPGWGAEERPPGPKPSVRMPILEAAIVALLALLVVPPLILTARSQVSAQRSLVEVSVTSDPTDASVIVDDLWVGRTPLKLNLDEGQEVALRLEAREPYLDYDLYKPFRKSLVLESDRNLHVWIPRTTAAEQAAQQAARR